MPRGRLITIGSFDGVHRGHQALLERTVSEARRRGLKTLAVTFQVPPKMVLEPAPHARLLTTVSEKVQFLHHFGMDAVETLQFSTEFASTRPFLFFRDLLLKRHGAKGLVVGADFRFGAGRSAGALELVRWGQEFEIPVWVIAPVRWRRTVVSSTLIRGLLEAGRFQPAAGFLGHGYLVSGPVVPGRRLGRTIGFPTANLEVPPEKLLPAGVFAGLVRLGGRSHDRIRPAVCNIGTRPTVAADGARTVEVHVLDFRGDLTGRTISIELLRRLRPERRFLSLDALKAAIGRDVRHARAWLADHRDAGSLYRNRKK